MRTAVEVILDASAVLAFIQNVAEVIAKLVRKTKDSAMVVRNLGLLKLRVHPWDEQAAYESANYAHVAAAYLDCRPALEGNQTNRSAYRPGPLPRPYCAGNIAGNAETCATLPAFASDSET